MSINETTARLMREQDVARALRLIDKYMGVYRSDKKQFALPEEHQYMEPVIKYYAERASGFAKYILRLRNAKAHDAGQYSALNKLYRTVFTRAVQKERRARAEKAVRLAEATYGPSPSFQERLAWIARREAEWARGRMEFLENVRQASGKGKLTREEANAAVADYWGQVDADISAGVPEWGE